MLNLKLLQINLLTIALTCGFSIGGTRYPIEGVAAMVDGEPILLGEVDELRQVMAQQQPGLSSSPISQQRRVILDRLIDEKVMLAKAKQDTTIKPNDKDIQTRAEDAYQRYVEQEGGDKSLEIALRQQNGMTLLDFRERLRQQFRNQFLQERLKMKYVGSPDPSQLQVQQFFDKFRDSLPVQRDAIHLAHLQLRIRANDSLDKAARVRADSAIKRLEAGESFAELAKALSEDPSGAEGGDLGFTKRGTLDPDFERGAFSLASGDYTRFPIHSRYGYHVIRVTGKKDNEVRTSHILFRIIPSSADTLKAQVRADSLVKKLSLPTANFAATAKVLSDDRRTKDLGGDLGWFPKDQIDPKYKALVDTLETGSVGGPILIGDSWHILKVMNRVSERHLTMNEDYESLNQMARAYLGSEKLQGFVKKWRETIAIEDRLARFAQAPVEATVAPEGESGNETKP